MTREEKIKLLKEISNGTKPLKDLLTRGQVLIKSHSKFKTLEGREFKLDLSDCPKYLLNGTIVILPENGRESY